jgi:hypothetical protein
MLTAEITQTSPCARGQPPRVLFPLDPSDDELARDFSLSEVDKVEVCQCRGEDNRRRFALQLRVVRKYGRFLGSYQQVPVKILPHLSRQLELSPVLFVPDVERGATESDYQERIHRYLGYRPFDQRVQDEVIQWLGIRATDGHPARRSTSANRGPLAFVAGCAARLFESGTISRFGGGAGAAVRLCPHRCDDRCDRLEPI